MRAMGRAVILLALALAGCVGVAPAPVSSACAWLTIDRPDPGFEHRWTRAEKEWAVRFNRDARAACPNLR